MKREMTLNEERLQEELNLVEWEEFLMEEVFVIKDGYYNKKPPFNKDGDIPFLGASLFNNAVTGFVDENIVFNYDKNGNKNNKDVENRMFDGNCLSVVNNGTAIGNAYFQEKSFTCSHDVTPIYLKDYEMNLDIALFLIPLIAKSGEPFKYANKWRPIRMRRSKIILPVTKFKVPDWEFMELFIKRVEEAVNPDFSFESNKIIDKRELEDIDWDEFFIESLFNTQRGKRLTKNNQFNGKVPYASSTGLNNGIDNFIGNTKNVRIFESCLTIANSGSVGKVFYHPYSFIASDHVTHIANNELSKYSYLFVATMLEKMEDKYSFNREISDKRLKREKIMLPINRIGEPDWLFMEQYMKRIENELKNKFI